MEQESLNENKNKGQGQEEAGGVDEPVIVARIFPKAKQRKPRVEPLNPQYQTVHGLDSDEILGDIEENVITETRTKPKCSHVCDICAKEKKKSKKSEKNGDKDSKKD